MPGPTESAIDDDRTRLWLQGGKNFVEQDRAVFARRCTAPAVHIYKVTLRRLHFHATRNDFRMSRTES